MEAIEAALATLEAMRSSAEKSGPETAESARKPFWTRLGSLFAAAAASNPAGAGAATMAQPPVPGKAPSPAPPRDAPGPPKAQPAAKSRRANPVLPFGSKRDIVRAIVASEILSPPIALREREF